MKVDKCQVLHTLLALTAHVQSDLRGILIHKMSVCEVNAVLREALGASSKDHVAILYGATSSVEVAWVTLSFSKVTIQRFLSVA
jgi:hypothetical protein